MSEVVSELKVMESEAGFYLGRSYHESDSPELEMPYNRDTSYYPSREVADVALTGHLKVVKKLARWMEKGYEF